MKAPVELALFAVTTVSVFAIAFSVGSAIDPIASDDRPVDLSAGLPAPGALTLPGLAVSDRGYTLRLADPAPGSGDAVALPSRSSARTGSRC